MLTLLAALAPATLPQAGAAPGVTLLSPFSQTDTVLLDRAGAVVHSWPSDASTYAAYLTPDGLLLRSSVIATGHLSAAATGRIELVAWDGTPTWQHVYWVPDQYCAHHDVEWLPNGNVLVIAWTWKTRQQAIDAGRDPAYLDANPSVPFLPDHLVELQPQPGGGATVVWAWHVWDHLVQDFDPTKPNYGVVADHPERLDVNFPPSVPFNDWNHLNTVDYDAELDQVLVTSRHWNEVWVIDHATTTAEAASSAGGAHGRGGDLLYRWGNPQAYGRGSAADQQLFGPHDAQWIPAGRPGAGHLLVFDNGLNRPAGAYSTVDELAPPLTPLGDYALAPGAAWGPTSTTWEYAAPNPTDFYSPSVSGCERLADGHTLVYSGDQGWLFEVDAAGALVWQHVNTLPDAAHNRFFKARHYAAEAPTTYCAAGPNSVSASGAHVSASGPASVTANALVVHATDLPHGQLGIFFHGPVPLDPGVSFGAGLRCVASSGLVRLNPPISTGAGSCARALDLTSGSLAGTLPGDVQHFQFWYRDPAGLPAPPFNLTEGLRVAFAP
ncbi:MAG: aryl-sulfate sulfotransferase [Planctomycetes bacterium]|nr:aryl-sulfate sulfotransferase [Planctomycetota bacterium]